MLNDNFKTHICTLEKENSRMSIVSLCPGIVGMSVLESLSVYQSLVSPQPLPASGLSSTNRRPGCPDYLRLISGRAKASGVAFEPPYLPKSFTAYVQRNDPTQFPYTASDASNPFVGKKVLVLSGGDDPLVSWEFSDEFVKHLNVGKDGVKKVIVYPGVGHACTAEMVKEAADFVWDNVLSAA